VYAPGLTNLYFNGCYERLCIFNLGHVSLKKRNAFAYHSTRVVAQLHTLEFYT